MWTKKKMFYAIRRNSFNQSNKSLTFFSASKLKVWINSNLVGHCAGRSFFYRFGLFVLLIHFELVRQTVIASAQKPTKSVAIVFSRPFLSFWSLTRRYAHTNRKCMCACVHNNLNLFERISEIRRVSCVFADAPNIYVCIDLCVCYNDVNLSTLHSQNCV